MKNRNIKFTTILPVLIALALVCFAFLPTAQAVCQEGCLNLNNTVLGEDALLNNSATDNTAVGFQALTRNTTGGGNTALGYLVLPYNTTGHDNTATGFSALQQNTIGSENTADGYDTLLSNTTGSNNSALGNFAMERNTTGNDNAAFGYSALNNNTTGSNNTAIGVAALEFNNADNNTATGFQALFNNSTGSPNTAYGANALFSNTTGYWNTATGFDALYYNTTGAYNVANGLEALYGNTTGYSNTANGTEALYSNTTGSDNTGTGVNALVYNTTGLDNTAEGFAALENNTTGSSNIALGSNAGINLTTGSNNIDIGNAGVAGESKRIRIGTSGTQTKTFIAGISGVTVPGGVGVIVGTNGQLGTVVSSARFKDQIQPMDKASEAILALKPVTFRYKKELDPDSTPQFGLVAEDVEKIDPDLVARGENGKPYSVRYEAVNAMLLNEFLKEHREVEALKATVLREQSINTEQQKEIQVLTGNLQEQATQIHKVSAELQMTSSAIKVAGNGN